MCVEHQVKIYYIVLGKVKCEGLILNALFGKSTSSELGFEYLCKCIYTIQLISESTQSLFLQNHEPTVQMYKFSPGASKWSWYAANIRPSVHSKPS